MAAIIAGVWGFVDDTHVQTPLSPLWYAYKVVKLLVSCYRRKSPGINGRAYHLKEKEETRLKQNSGD